MTKEMLNTGQPPQDPQSLIDYEFMEKMGRDLVRLCDGIEKHGLVDYQMGVAEEDILEGEIFIHKPKVIWLIRYTALTTCLDLLEPSGSTIPAPAAPAPAAPPRRR